MMKLMHVVSLTAFAAAASAGPITGQWSVRSPGNTGIPGEEIRTVDVGPDGLVYVGARWPFWQDGGVGILDRETQVWDSLARNYSPLPSEFVNDIEFGPGGVIWIATGNGLARVQDEQWTIYTTSNSPLLHNVVREIDLDSDGHVWINNTNVQNQNAALFEFDGSTWRSWSVPEIPFENPWRQLAGLHVDKDDIVWIANATLSGFARYDGASWTLLGANVGTFDFITSDLDQNLWLISGGLSYTFYKYDGQSFATYSSANTPFVQTTVTTMAVDDNGDLYVGNWAGQIIRTSDAGQSWTAWSVENDIVFNIAPDPASDEVWIGARSLVVARNTAGQTIQSLNTWNTGLPDYFVDRFSLDRDGHLWLHTGEAGSSRFDGDRWRNFGDHNLGSEPYAFPGNEPTGTVYQARNGVHWMGGNGIARWDSSANTITGMWNWQNNPGLGVTLFPFFAEDHAGRLFAFSENGATFWFDGSVWQRDTTVQPYAPLGLPGVAVDPAGDVWIAAWFELHRWNGAVWTTVGEDWGLFDLEGATDIAFDQEGVMWLGTAGGLMRVENGVRTLFTAANSPMPANAVSGVDVRQDGTLAFSVSDFQSTTPFPNGVCIVRGDINEPTNWSVWQYGTSPIPHYQLGDVAFDANGDLWVSAISEGVAVLDIDDLPVFGDLDGDGLVNFADLNLLLSAYNSTGAGLPEDLDNDGDVDFADLNLLLGVYNQGA